MDRDPSGRKQRGEILFEGAQFTPARTHSISGLKSRVFKLTFLALK